MCFSHELLKFRNTHTNGKLYEYEMILLILHQFLKNPLLQNLQLRPISLTNTIMRILEKIVFKQEIYPQVKKVIDDDQFAYKKGTSTTTALIKCHHNWLKWLDDDADYVRVISLI